MTSHGKRFTLSPNNSIIESANGPSATMRGVSLELVDTILRPFFDLGETGRLIMTMRHKNRNSERHGASRRFFCDYRARNRRLAPFRSQNHGQ